MARSRPQLPELPDNTPLGVLPPPELLDRYAAIDPMAIHWVTQQWGLEHGRAFRYAMTALSIGGVLGLSLVSGFIYLVMQGHATSAGILLGGGALSMVAGFRSVRL